MKKKICVVIPCYKVSNKIDDVIKQIDFNIVDKIFLIDDCCPENTGKLIKNRVDEKKSKSKFLIKI